MTSIEPPSCSCARLRTWRFRTRSTSPTWTGCAATATSAFRSPPASRKSWSSGTSLDRSTPGRAAQERVDDHCQPRRRRVGRDLGHRVPAREHCRRRPSRSSRADDVVAMLKAAIEGMKKRGQSDLGDKTLLDAFVPAVDEFERADRRRRAPVPRRSGRRASSRARRPKRSSRGSPNAAAPSYTGERSCGTYDAGSIAVAMMAEQLAAAWEQLPTVV